MKKNINYLFLASVLGLGLTSCGDDYDNYTVGEEQSVNNQGVYFALNRQTLEFAPEAATMFEIEVSRLNIKEKLSMPLEIALNTDDVFEVPATAEFAAGDSIAIVSVNFPKAELGNAYTLIVTVPSEYRSTYATFDGSLSTSITVARVKWESIGTCYWQDGIVSTWYGVTTGPFAVEVEKAVTPTSTKYRFVSPYSHYSEEKDAEGIGYLGYPYSTEEGIDYDNEDHMFVITVTGKSATLDPVDLGVDFGSGIVNTGTILGVISNDDSKYSYGYPAADGSKIVFEASSLYVDEPDYGTGVCSKASILYLKPDELLVPDEYQPVGYGTYNFDAFFGWNAEYPDYCVFELCRSTEDTTKYRIDGWDLLGNVDALYFNCNEDGIVNVEEQFTGYTDGDDETEGYVGMGEINVSSFVQTNTFFNEETLDYQTDTVAISSYNPESNTFNFNLIYAGSVAGKVSYGVETFVVAEWYSEGEEVEDPVEASMRRRATFMVAEKTIKRRPTIARKALVKKTF